MTDHIMHRPPPPPKPPSWAAAASGASTPCSTTSPACSRSNPATPGAQCRIRPTRRSAAARTGHAEVVQITFDPAAISFRELLTVFFTIHDPTTRDRQGNDVGTQYRSVIFCQTPEQRATPKPWSPSSRRRSSGAIRSSPRSPTPRRSTRPRATIRTTSRATAPALLPARRRAEGREVPQAFAERLKRRRSRR